MSVCHWNSPFLRQPHTHGASLTLELFLSVGLGEGVDHDQTTASGLQSVSHLHSWPSALLVILNYPLTHKKHEDLNQFVFKIQL